MPRQIAKLSPRGVETLKTPGRHSDGAGLYLIVDPPGPSGEAGAKRWVFIYRFKRSGRPGAGRLREMGLGSFTKTSLAKARLKAAEARELLGDGIDPIEARRHLAAVPTFGELADHMVALREKDLRNEKSRYRWRRALEVHAADLRPLKVDVVTSEDVRRVLEPIWLKTPDAASKVRGCIEAVLDAARANGHRTGENPARWRGHLDHLLPKQPKLVRGHHAALPFAELPTFMAELRARNATAALALEFCILTASRSGEVIGAQWSEFDLKTKVWTIPALRMKGGREHRVPLSERATEILKVAAQLRKNTADAAIRMPNRGQPRGQVERIQGCNQVARLSWEPDRERWVVPRRGDLHALRTVWELGLLE